jgi:hypothetical protein
MMLDFMLPVFPEVIKPDAVSFGIHYFYEFATELDKLGRVNQTFKNGSLNALSIVKARLGNPAEAVLSGGSGRGNIVGDKDIHD